MTEDILPMAAKPGGCPDSGQPRLVPPGRHHEGKQPQRQKSRIAPGRRWKDVVAAEGSDGRRTGCGAGCPLNGICTRNCSPRLCARQEWSAPGHTAGLGCSGDLENASPFAPGALALMPSWCHRVQGGATPGGWLFRRFHMASEQRPLLIRHEKTRFLPNAAPAACVIG